MDLSKFIGGSAPPAPPAGDDFPFDRKIDTFLIFQDLSSCKKNIAGEWKREFGEFPSKQYSKFFADMLAACSKDLIFLAEEMNERPSIPPEMHHLFYFHSIPGRRRFAKLFKEDKSRSEAISALSDYFGWARGEASKNLAMFSQEEISAIQAHLLKEGEAK
jgi:hypothetical protein